MNAPTDRRLHRRLPIHRPVKIYDPASRRYRAALTRNLSAGGAMIEVRGGVHARVGDQIMISIGADAEKPIIAFKDLQPAFIERVLPPVANTQFIAVRFAVEQTIDMPMAA